MNDREFKANIELYLLGEVDDNQASQMRTYVETHPQAQADLDQAAAFLAELDRHLSGPPVPAGLPERVLGRLGEHGVRKEACRRSMMQRLGRVPIRLRRPAMAAATVLLVVGGSFLWREATRPKPVDQPVAAGPTAADLQLAVARAGVATGLVGAADYLAEQPGGQEIAVQRLHYVIQTYPETQGAAQARSRLQSRAEQRGQL